ncbi:sodium:dicarboxylate symporter [Clostridium sulfidigenes]|uniref:Sodium:dicarboxylate symporter n=1 Tax=Clostridium sulfidigenes TaxID=318464 RepID=A0A084JAQ5_9CLOT|nr:dicarboxylate/amino acid:cation symporter [Clostridium sulfidigenes]KEZ86039.1 sodium:dicarboxylate symporter [Clostridium sulfidigenes]
MKKGKISLSTKIFIGLILGLITGIIFNFIPQGFIRDELLINGVFYLVGQAFLKAIMMLVVPLVFISLVNGAASMGDIKKLGRIGVKTVLFYLATTAIAISIALSLSTVFKPGVGLNLSNSSLSEVTIKEAIPLVEVILDMIPNNPIASMANGNMLQIIVFAMLIGVGLSTLGEKTKMITNLFQQLNDLIMKIVDFVMIIAPIGVFGLIARTFATQGFDAMIPLIKYMSLVLISLLIHATIVYGGLLKLFTRLSPIRFFKKFFPAISVAFSTSSSSATLPVSMEIAEENLGISKDVASFTLPLGATINMDGTAIMQGVATVFIAQIYGVDLTLSSFLTVILTATLASIGTAGVPGVGMIMLSMVLQSVGLPVEGIALIMGIDRILDMARTSVNITGDAVCTMIVAKAEGEFNEEIFNSETIKNKSL